MNGPRLRQELGLTSSPSICCLDRVPLCVVVACQVRRRAVLLRVLCPPLRFFLAPYSPPIRSPISVAIHSAGSSRPRASWSRRCGPPEAGVDDDGLVPVFVCKSLTFVLFRFITASLSLRSELATNVGLTTPNGLSEAGSWRRRNERAHAIGGKHFAFASD